MLAAISQQPGALVLLDSLRSICRSLEKGENDPEIGAILYDLKAAVIKAGSTPVLIHHANKGSGVGMEALSGHNAIAGAANTLLTLHYLLDDKGRPVKDIPQRRLVREARSGDGFDLVISFTAGSGGFHRVGTYTEWQEQAQQEKQDKQEAEGINGLTTLQREVLEMLEVAAEERPGAWLTRREVCEAVGVTWIDRGRDKEGQRMTRALARLHDLGQIERQRAGNETTYRMPSHETPETVMTAMPTSDANGSGVITASDDSDYISQPPTPLSSLSSPTRDRETPFPDSLSSLSSLSFPEWLPELMGLRDQFPGDHPATLALKIKGATVTGARVKEVLENFGNKATAADR